VATMVRSLLGGDDLYQHQLWDLLMLELWHRVYIDSSPRIPAAQRLPIVRTRTAAGSADDGHPRPVPAG
jgi:hypothetical protein